MNRPIGIAILTIACAWTLHIMADETGEGIRWTSDYQAGLDQAVKENKGVLLDFTAEWCGWCEKMDKEVFSASNVTGMLRDYVCIKVDIDKNPDIAGAYQVQSIPRTVFLNVNQEIIGDRMGFVPESQFIGYLQAQAEDLHKQTGGTKAPHIAAAPTPASMKSAVAKRVDVEGPDAILDLLGEPDPQLREIVQTKVVETGESMVPVLVAGLSHDYLGTRIASLAALQSLVEGTPEFDPWATAEERKVDLEPWREWLSTRLMAEIGERAVQEQVDAALIACTALDTASAQLSAARTAGGPVDSWTWQRDDGTIVTAVDTSGDSMPDEANAFRDIRPGIRLMVVAALANGEASIKSKFLEYVPKSVNAQQESGQAANSTPPSPLEAPLEESAPSL
ncbi:MAG: hypothetical protein AMXMBFR84_29800 [Candidatus Hydrogenedentota bacterium]